MSALAAGRGISLPSLSAAGAAFAAHTTGAYARIREQFHQPIGRFEAIQERLGRMAATAYLLDAARRLTCAGIDHGHKPAVITAIMKAQATERLRVVVNDAMDVHGGKGVQDGPHNYLGTLYRAVPIGITVEGANIVTRSLIQFGQGAIRSHPYLLKEMTALEDPDRARGLEQFDRDFWAPCRTQLHQCVARLGPRLDRRCVRAGARGGRGEPLLPAARALCLGLRARGRCRLADARRRAQAPGDDLRAFRRHALGALSPLGRAQALGGRGAPGGRSAAGGVVHAERLRHHRGAGSTRSSPIFPTGRRRGCCAFCCCRSGAPARSVRPADAGLRRDPAQPLGGARPADRRSLPRHRRRRASRGSSAPSSSHRGRAVARAPAQGARARHRPGATAGTDQRRRGGATACRRGGRRRRRRGR